MMNSILLSVILLSSTSISLAQEPSQKLEWRKAMRATDRDWDGQKQAYEGAMANYFYAAYEFDSYDNQTKNLEAQIKALSEQVNKPVPEGLNSATQAVWEKKVGNQKADLTRLQAQYEEMKKKRDDAEATLKIANPEIYKKGLDEAAKAANLNAVYNDRNDIRRGQKILRETNSVAASDLLINDLTRKADESARRAFEEAHPKVTIPGTRRVLQFTQATPTKEEVKNVVVDLGKELEKSEPEVTAENQNLTQVSKSAVAGATEAAKMIAKTNDGAKQFVDGLNGATAGTQGSNLTSGANASTGDECDAAKTEIVKLLLSKENNPKAFSDMAYLAQLKMAYRLASQKPTPRTLEAFVKEKGLQRDIKVAYNQHGDFNKSLTSLYQKYGKLPDAEKQNRFLDKDLSYRTARLQNDSASAVILYLLQNEQNPKFPFTESDAAAVWAQQKLIDDRGYKTGSADANLLSFNRRVCQMFVGNPCTGSGGKFAYDSKTIAKEYDKRQKAFADSVKKAGEGVMKEHPLCFSKECAPNSVPKLGSSDLESIKSKIAELVGKGSLSNGDTSVEVDSSKTTAKNGDLTIYLKPTKP